MYYYHSEYQDEEDAGGGSSQGARMDVRTRHLIVHLAQRRTHFVGESAGDDHDITLPGAWTKDNAKPVQVIPSSSAMHHLHSAASKTCQTERMKLSSCVLLCSALLTGTEGPVRAALHALKSSDLWCRS